MYDYGYSDYGSTVSSVLGALAIFIIIVIAISMAVGIVTIIAQWKVYKKAGKGGWEAIIPFYSNWVLVEVAELKWYWFLGFFGPLVLGMIPEIEFLGYLVYLFTTFNVFYNISKKFNKGAGFAIGLTLLTPIFLAILGFSKKNVYNKNIPVSSNGVFGKPDSNTQNGNQSANQQQTQQTQPIVPPVAPVQEQPTVQQPVQEPVNQNQTPSFCTNCGSALAPGSKFCTNCGKQI